MALSSQAVSFHLESREVKDCPISSFRVTPDDPNEIYWVHLDPTNAPALATLKLPEELLEELKEPESFPDVTETEDSLTLVLHYWEPSSEGPAEPSRLLIHLTDRYCLTVTNDRIPALDRFQTTCRREFRFAKTPGFILFLILDYLVDDFTKILRSMDRTSETIDDRIQNDFSEGLNRQILDLKRQVITLKHLASSLRDTLMRVSGRRIAVVSESCRESLGEVYQHAQGLVNQLEALRELANNSLEAYNTALAQRMNRTMKVLTVFASIVLPMSLIAGIYGMNFQRIPELGWKYGYHFALGLMSLCAVGLLLLFRKKGWF